MSKRSASFEDLFVWKRSSRLAIVVFEILRDAKVYSLKDQMERAAVSIPSNIAEGSQRPSRDFRRVLRIAMGSAAELRKQAYVATKIGMIDASSMSRVVSELKEISRMLVGLSCSLKCDQKAGQE